MTSASPKRRLSSEQRRALELLASDPRGATGHLLVIAHGFEMKMLAGLPAASLFAQENRWSAFTVYRLVVLNIVTYRRLSSAICLQ
jgi:hypothetical protein